MTITMLKTIRVVPPVEAECTQALMSRRMSIVTWARMRFGPRDEECPVVVSKGNWAYVVSSSAEMDSESVSTAESRKVEVISNYGDKSR